MLIGLCLDFYSGYDDGLLRGIGAYARPHKTWTFDHAFPTLAGVRGLLAQRPRGVIIRTADAELLKLLRQATVRVVNISNQPKVPGVAQVSNDNRAIGAMAAEHLLRRGHTRFAYYALLPARVDERLRGFQEHLRLADRDCDVFLGGPDDVEPEALEAYERELNLWLQKLVLPVAIFCDGDRFAWMITERCRRLGLRVPEQVAILGVDNVASMCALADPPLSSVQTASERIGYEAAQALEQMLSDKVPNSLSIQVPPVRVAGRRSTDGVTVEDPWVHAALEHMRSHLIDTQGIDWLSDKIGCSRRTLERRFRESLGYSPADAWARFRLEEAERLLADTELSLTAVAERCGFHVPKQMASVFRRMLGYGPRDFRKLAQPGYVG
ncbi:MAG: substrate-binding domain-containing protein [Polyangiaceae bacterium]|nr:substrate-binding domain-containing protein [Polyangiaceae bacterium]